MTGPAEGFVADVLGTIGSFDRVFVAWRHDGARPATAAALARFWDRPEAAPLRAVADRPQLDWGELTGALLDLAAGPPESTVDWVALAEAADGLEPAASAMVMVYALAGWMGARGDRLLRFPPDPGWFALPARAGRALLAADAVHGAELVVTRAREFVEEGERDVYEPGVQARLTPLREVAAGLAQRRAADIAALAWDLRAACRATGPGLRAELAALLWTVGDVPRAYLLAGDTTYVPPLNLLQDLVATTMARVRDDPLLQYVWLAMKDRPPLDLRRHHRLFALLNARYTHRDGHRLDLLPTSAGPLYAEALIAHFGAGPSAELLGEFDTAVQLAMAVLEHREPLLRLRLAGLHNLLLNEPDEQPDRWRDLARGATGILRAAVRLGDFTAFHRCLALPVFYLPDAPALAAVEQHRGAGLQYWLTAAPPAPPPRDGLAEPLQAQIGLLEQLRGARFVRATPHLPSAYQRLVTNFRAAIRHGDAGVHPLDQERADRLLRQAWQDLDALWQRMRAIDPGYADRRADPVSGLDDFAAALTATSHPTLPMGAFPVRREPPDRPDPPAAPAEDLQGVADELVRQYHRTNDLTLLDAAIDAETEAGPGLDGPDRVRHLDRLAMMHGGRFLHTEAAADIDAAVTAHEAAAALTGVPAPLGVEVRFNAGVTRHHRFRHTGDAEDLRRAVAHWRAVTRMPDLPPERALVVYDRYADGLRELSAHTDDPALPADVVTAQRAVVALTPAADPGEAGRRAQLALDLLVLARRGDGPAGGAVTEAVDLLRDAVRLARRGDPHNLVQVLNNLAIALLIRDAGTDFDDAVAALEEAAATAPIGPTRDKLLHDLAGLREQRRP